MVFGDSTSQGYGVELFGEYYENIPPGKMYADLLRNKLKVKAWTSSKFITVINESLGSEFAFEVFLNVYHFSWHTTGPLMSLGTWHQ